MNKNKKEKKIKTVTDILESLPKQYTLKIKDKYLQAIIRGEKKFELRDQEIKPNSKIILISNQNNTLTFISGECTKITKDDIIEFNLIKMLNPKSWIDEFVINYCLKKYLEKKEIYKIQIKEIKSYSWNKTAEIK